MNASASLRLLCASVAFGFTAAIFSAVVSLANITTEDGATTLMSLNQHAPAAASVAIAMVD